MQLPSAKSMLHAAQAGKEAVFDLVLPSACRLCNQGVPSRDDFCRSCELALTLTEPAMRTACFRCGNPKAHVVAQTHALDSEGDVDSVDRVPVSLPHCVHCRDLELCFEGVVTLWSYQDRVCEAVVAAKYASQSALGDAMGRRLGVRVETVLEGDVPDLVTYVPSHFTRQFARGGSGNQVIAGAVARVIGCTSKPLLRTTRRISKQAWLDDAQRIANVHGAFSAKKSYAFARSPGFANQHILVVDDVLTTGATANEVARVLQQGGARRVSLAVVARAIRSQ